MVRIFVGAVGMLLSGCGPAWGASPSESFEISVVGEQPGGDGLLGAVGRADRFLLRGEPVGSMAEVWLVEGELSGTSSKRLARRDPPESIEERRLPLAAWPSAEGWILAPLQALEPGGNYSFAALGFGFLAAFEVSESPEPLWERQGEGAVRPGDWVVHCTAEPWGDAEAGSLRLGPSSREVRVERGLGASALLADRCIALQLPADWSEPYFVAEGRFDGVALAPAPVIVRQEDAPDEAAPLGVCERGQLSACVRAERAGVTLSLAAGLHAIRIEQHDTSTGGRRFERVVWGTEPSQLVFGPLLADREVEVVVVSVSGPRISLEEHRLDSGPAAGRPVLNEVLADALGAEPASEWVEIQNVGTAAVRLSDFTLSDAGGAQALPDVTLGPGQFGLLVGFDFRASADLDVVPHPDALPILVPRVGTGGLLNGGEALRLSAADGALVSALPALPGRPGISVARRLPWAPDQADSFAIHGAPGASPGAPNTFDDTAP